MQVDHATQEDQATGQTVGTEQTVGTGAAQVSGSKKRKRAQAENGATGADEHKANEEPKSLLAEPGETRAYRIVFIGKDAGPLMQHSLYGLWDGSGKISCDTERCAVFVHCGYDEVDARMQWLRSKGGFKQVIIWKVLTRTSAPKQRASSKQLATPTSTFVLLAVNWDVDCEKDVAHNYQTFEMKTSAASAETTALHLASMYFSHTPRLYVTVSADAASVRRSVEYDKVVLLADSQTLRFVDSKRCSPTSAPEYSRFQRFLDMTPLPVLQEAKRELDIYWNAAHKEAGDMEKRVAAWKRYVPFLPDPQAPDLYVLAKTERYARRLATRISILRKERAKNSDKPSKRQKVSDEGTVKKPRQPMGFAALAEVSPALWSFIERNFPDQIDPSQASLRFKRTHFQKLMSNYIKMKDLQDKTNKQQVNIGNDAELHDLLQPAQPIVSYMDLPGLLNPHFFKKTSSKQTDEV